MFYSYGVILVRSELSETGNVEAENGTETYGETER